MPLALILVNISLIALIYILKTSAFLEDLASIPNMVLVILLSSTNYYLFSWFNSFMKILIRSMKLLMTDNY